MREVKAMKRRDDLLIGPKENAITAVKAGKKEDAIKYIEELYQDFKPLHDRYSAWIQCLLNFVAEKLGEEAVEEALGKTWTEVYKQRQPTTTASPEEIAKRWCKSHRCHYSNFYVEEDDEKFVIVIPFCGSGGRMYNENITGKTKKAYPWSFNLKGATYYCGHEPVFEAMAQEEGTGLVHYDCQPQFDKDGNPKGLMCRYTTYKTKRPAQND
jgi:hypothetical protein